MPQCPLCKVDSKFNYIGVINVECVTEGCNNYSDQVYEESKKALPVKTPVPDPPDYEDDLLESYTGQYVLPDISFD